MTARHQVRNIEHRYADALNAECGDKWRNLTTKKIVVVVLSQLANRVRLKHESGRETWKLRYRLAAEYVRIDEENT